MEEKELLGKGLLEDSTPKDVVEYFDAYDLLDAMDERDIAEYISDYSNILDRIDDDTLIGAVSDENVLIHSIEESNIVSALEEQGYKVIESAHDGNTDDEILNKLKDICRELQPRGYIRKEDVKKIITDYLDTWTIHCF